MLDEISQGVYEKTMTGDFSVNFEKDMPQTEAAGSDGKGNFDDVEREALQKLLGEIEDKGSL